MAQDYSVRAVIAERTASVLLPAELAGAEVVTTDLSVVCGALPTPGLTVEGTFKMMLELYPGLRRFVATRDGRLVLTDRRRTSVLLAAALAHAGAVFTRGNTPTNNRYELNSTPPETGHATHPSREAL